MCVVYSFSSTLLSTFNSSQHFVGKESPLCLTLDLLDFFYKRRDLHVTDSPAFGGAELPGLVEYSLSQRTSAWRPGSGPSALKTFRTWRLNRSLGFRWPTRRDVTGNNGGDANGRWWSVDWDSPQKKNMGFMEKNWCFNSPYTHPKTFGRWCSFSVWWFSGSVLVFQEYTHLVSMVGDYPFFAKVLPTKSWRYFVV